MLNVLTFSLHIRLTQCAEKRVNICVYVHKLIAKGVKQILADYKDVIYVVLDKMYFRLEKDLIIGFVYISPENSVYYEDKDKDSLDCLDDALCEISNKYEADIILTGDFNCRTGEDNDYISFQHFFLPGGVLADLKRSECVFNIFIIRAPSSVTRVSVSLSR